MTVSTLTATPALSQEITYTYALSTEREAPILFFLHGAGERGSDPAALYRHGPLKYIVECGPLPFHVIAPLCPEEGWWALDQLDRLDLLFSHVMETLPADPSRIFLTGISMGGFGTWHWALRHPKRFAAIAPFCGGGIPYLAPRLAHLPVWAFHGMQDDVIPPAATLDMTHALERAGATPRVTLFDGVGHDCWTQVYADASFYSRLLSLA